MAAAAAAPSFKLPTRNADTVAACLERFNRRIVDAIPARPATTADRGKNKFATHAERDAFLLAVVTRYNHTRLKCLHYQTPAALVSNPPEHDTKAGMWSGFPARSTTK